MAIPTTLAQNFKHQDWTVLETNNSQHWASGTQDLTTITVQEGSASQNNEANAAKLIQASSNPIPFKDTSSISQAHTNGRTALSSARNLRQHSGKRKLDKVHGPKHGKRKGPLNPTQARNATKVRKIRACWSCWLLKTPCTDEAICYRCRTSFSASLTARLCSRERFVEYSALFSPLLLVSHLQQAALETLLEASVLSFGHKSIEIKVSSGPMYSPIVVSVCEFQPVIAEFLSVKIFHRSDDNNSSSSCSYSLPLGLPPNTDADVLKETCLRHVKSIISNNRDYDAEVNKFGEMSLVSWKVYLAVNRYAESSHTREEGQLLHKALMLHAMHYFMGRNLAIVDNTGEDAYNSLLNSPRLPYDCSLTSRLLNRQLKHSMQSLLQETTIDVLDGLERELKQKKRQSWGACFCAILVLSMCIEQLQVAIDGLVVQRIAQCQTVGVTSRENGMEIARKLDDVLYTDCKTIFHAIYRSSKTRRGQRSEKGFNPIRDVFEIDEEEGMTAALRALIEDINEILGIHETDMIQRAKPPSFNSEIEVVESQMVFRERNSGRLVSDFLRSFLGAS